jgi:pimeloyl-ACP methyl ester carboxylesterase
MSRKLTWGGLLALLAVLGAFGGGLWSSSNQLLFPSWRGATKDLSVCGPELARYWGEGCGNLRTTHEFRFSEAKVPSLNGYDLPGWLIGAADNSMGPAEGAIMLIHGGGSDRRELTRHVRFYLRRHLDVLTLDLGCHGEAPCPVPGLTYGQRESHDVLSAYLFLTSRYDKVLAMGSSVGAASLLVALPEMPKLKGVIAENPLASFEKLIVESPAARSIPGWFTQLLIKLTMLRGRFDGLMSPERSVRFTKTTPVFFIHSMRDSVVSAQQTRSLADAYAGPKTAWFPDKGDHGAIWDADHADYEQRLTTFLNSTPGTRDPSIE